MSIVALENAGDVALYGGKAANLARLLQAELPVPGGLAVSVEAFGKDGVLKQKYAEFLENSIDSTKTYAVRSSALVEDAVCASWAGQFESFLNMHPHELVQTVEKCHGSARERAHAYAANMGGLKGKFAVAVVVQEMLAPTYAGVLFTTDPVSGDDQFVIEYVRGLGEQLVSGEVNPEHVEWHSGPMPSAPFKVSDLIGLAQKVEHLFKVPQDIEWAESGGKVWLLQARPVTNL